MPRSYTLVINCPDRPGIVQHVSGLIFEHGGNILESRQFEDRETGRFFLRTVFESDCERSVMADGVAKLDDEFAMDWKLVPTGQPVKVLILVSKFDHCLAYLLAIALLSGLLLTVVLSFSHFLGRWLGFNREDRIVLQFCGSKKSLASGVPMAGVLFATSQVGGIILPLMFFHQIQLMGCAVLARRYADQQFSAVTSQAA